ncbi:MAG: Ig-like domain-containing protein [Anaerolineae bacterium]|nr:Ig-like domain-containing protein [Anaerolineae bacterium]
MKTKRQLWFILLVMLAIVTWACQPFTKETPTPSPTAEPTATFTPAVTPTPTPTSIPFPAPRLAFHVPDTGETQPLDAPIEMTFDQAMDTDSVIAAFAISPTVDGEFAWTNPRTLRFTPAKPLLRGVSYQITVDDAARNTAGETVQEPIRFAFQTIGYLEVGEVQPIPDASDIAPDNAVTVVFNRPVVPLTSLEQQAALPHPLAFDPPVEGEGEWINTSIYRFHPSKGFSPSTRYKVTIAAGLQDVTGNILKDAYTWEFVTQYPRIMTYSPSRNAEYVPMTTTIRVTFNQSMDHQSVEKNFTLHFTEGNEQIPGTFRWSTPEPQKVTREMPEVNAQNFEVMEFTPDEPLSRNVRPTVEIKQDARSANGEATLPGTLTWNFSVVRDPGIVSVSPKDGTENVDVWRDLEITFASPMQTDGFMDYLDISPDVTEVYSYWHKTDTKLTVSFAMTPVTEYHVTLSGDAPDLYGAPLGEDLDIRFTTGNLLPYAYLNTRGWVATFNAYTDTVFYASYRNIETLDLALYRMSPDTFARYFTSGSDFSQQYTPAAEDLVRQWQMEAAPPPNTSELRRVDMVTEAGDQLPPGIYYLTLISPEVVAYNPRTKPHEYIFARSYINLTFKNTISETLVWATDLATGQPVPGLDVRLLRSYNHKYDEGTTDADGVYLVRNQANDNLWDDYFAFSGEPGSATFGVVDNNWTNGVSSWDFGVTNDYNGMSYRSYLYTDRPIYRPGQTVYFKGILRADDDAHYTLPAEIKEIKVLIEDPSSKKLYDEKLTLTGMGTFSGALTLDAEAPLGTYYVRVDDAKRDIYASVSFRVAEYRKPEFQVGVQTDKDAYLSGETLKATVDATYYFGGPVANANVHWNLLSADYAFQYQCPRGEKCPWYSWTDYDWDDEDLGRNYGGYGRLVAEGDAMSDDQGRALISTPTDISEEISSRTFTLEASVTDINDQYVSNRTAAVVHKGLFYIGLAPQGRIVEAGKERGVDILTVDWDSEPVPDVDLDVIFMEHRWYNVREEGENGRAYWTWTTEDVPVFTTTATTDDLGKAVVTFTPPGSGSYRVRAIGKDARGNRIQSSAYIWVWGGWANWRRDSTNRITLIADKDEYRVGDVAEILVPSPYSGTVKALITIERGHIISAEVRELHNNSEIIKIPIISDYVPNVFVSIIIVQGSDNSVESLASFKMGLIQLPVSIEEKELHITLTPDRTMDDGEYYRPRETAIYDLLVTDHAGKPVEAELSLRLADLAVLALADETGQTLLERFWSQRGLGVRTAMPLSLAMEDYNRDLSPKAKGGGGGDAADFIRSNFADTAYWNPIVHTGKDGKAQVEVKLPDNLTTWRMQARGITTAMLVGRTDVDILSTLDLLVRPVLPRFFVVGDKAEIATIVHNNTGEPLNADVMLDAEGLEVEGALRQTVEVPAGDKVKVIWHVTVLSGEEVRIQMTTQSGNYRDGVENTLPVYRYATPEVMGTAGRISTPEARLELVQLPRSLDSTQGELTVQVDGSLTAATADSLKYLEHYPYECTEQTVSRFLPNVMTYQVLKEMGIERPELEAALKERVRVALQRLYVQQNYDGGWGWWANDSSSVSLTSYALHGLLEAHRAGFTVDQKAMRRAAEFLRNNLSIADKPNYWSANRLAYQLYVLGEYSTLVKGAKAEGELGYAITLYDRRQYLSLHGRATLAMALGLLEPKEKQRINTLLSDFAGEAIYSATGTHWEESRPDYWNMSTDVRTSAVILWAMSRHMPDSELLPNIVRWLMSVREGEMANRRYWESTYTTSWVMMSLIEYMRASGEMQGDFSYTVSLNGEILLDGDINKETLDETQKVQVEIARLLVDESNYLVLERQEARAGQTGAGQLYYTAHLRYFLPADEVKAAERGIVVARSYERLSDSPEDAPVVVGDLIQVRLTVIAPTDLYYVIVEDPLPAGCEAVDLGLKTTSVVGEAPNLQNLTVQEKDHWYRRYGWGWWWFSHAEIRDEKVTLFASYLPRGTYEYSYIMRASIPGTFNVIPTTASEMYFPEVWGRSDGERFVIEPE